MLSDKSIKYHKIPKISLRAYILFEGLVFGGAYIRRGSSMEGNLRLQIDWASLIYSSKKIYGFYVVLLCI